MNKTSITGLLLLLAALMSAGMATPCSAGTLRGEVLLDKDTITVGDVFGDVGAAAAQVVGPAPAPGHTVTYDVTALTQLARRFNVTWQPVGNYEKVTLKRASQVINAAMIKQRVAEELASTTQANDLDIGLDNASLEVHRNTGEKLDWHLADMNYDPVQRRFKGSLIVGSDSTAEVISISGRAMPMVQVGILNRGISGGSLFDDNSVDWVRVPVDKAGADAVTDASQLKDKEARRSLETKAVLRLRDVVNARLVQKGSMVTMQVTTPAMQIVTQGRVLSDGVMGDSVRVLNTQSNRTIDATVTGKNQVSVTPNGPSHLASADVK